MDWIVKYWAQALFGPLSAGDAKKVKALAAEMQAKCVEV